MRISANQAACTDPHKAQFAIVGLIQQGDDCTGQFCTGGVFRHWACLKCEQCGEVVLSADTVEKIEHILQTVEKAVAEITVVNFPDCAA